MDPGSDCSRTQTVRVPRKYGDGPVMIEDHVPEHNDDHYHTRRKRNFTSTHPNPDVVLQLIDRVLADRPWNRTADVPRPPVTIFDDHNPRDFRM